MMTLRLSHLLLIPVLSASLLFTTTAVDAQQVVPPAAKPAPISNEADAYTLLRTAKTVSVVDLGTDANFPPGDVNGTRRFREALRKWGRYQVVPKGAPADVTLQVEGLTQTGYVAATDDTAGYTTYSPYFRLTVIDPATGDALWDITAPVMSGRSHGEDLFEMSVRNLLSALKTFEGVELTKQELKDVRYLDRQRTKAGWIATTGVVLLVGAAVGGGILMKHKFDEDVAKQNADQHDFCVRNHIPGC